MYVCMVYMTCGWLRFTYGDTAVQTVKGFWNDIL